MARRLSTSGYSIDVDDMTKAAVASERGARVYGGDSGGELVQVCRRGQQAPRKKDQLNSAPLALSRCLRLVGISRSPVVITHS